MHPRALTGWHAIVASGDPRGLPAILADNVVFHSPVVHTPQVGKAITTAYLAAAVQVLGRGGFRYLGEWYAENSAVLEFVTEIDGVIINGVDMIAWNDEEKIASFKVMIRPLKAVNAVHQAMGAMLQKMKA